MPNTWQDISKRKKADQASRVPEEWLLPNDSKPKSNADNVIDIPRKCGLLNKQELHITENYDATALLQELRTGRLKSVDVTKAFSKRAAIAHQLTNCLTEIFFDEGIKRAEYLDEYLKEHGKPLGPLHGLPISLKDTFKVKGQDASIGFAAFAFNPSTEESNLVTLLLKAGAVLYCKTNVPQSLMALDSHNNVFGRVLNPLNLKVTAGGSSGGEGALVALRGSILGVGTDVGGSIRIPAMCNGLYGVKPSWQRVPYGQQQGAGQAGAPYLALPASAGPIATSMRDCEYFLKTVADMQPWTLDADVVYGLWQDQGYVKSKKDITIGIVRRDGLIDPLPPVNNIIDETACTLRAQGIQTIELDITSLFKQCQSLANILFGIDGNNHVFNVLENTGEPLSPWLSTRLRRKSPVTLDRLRAAHASREKLRTDFLKIWKDSKTGREIDAFICPVAPHPVPPIDRYNGVSYTSSFVLVDYPAGVSSSISVSVSVVSKLRLQTLPVRPLVPSDLAGEISSNPPIGPWDKTNRELWTNVNKDDYIGTPLCVQVVAPKMQERTLVNAMSIIDEALKAEFKSSRNENSKL
jgi:Asp-tRNA(Asn)/Glu-tRNA(Gln) amidotransferase A subunit family amidase